MGNYLIRAKLYKIDKKKTIFNYCYKIVCF